MTDEKELDIKLSELIDRLFNLNAEADKVKKQINRIHQQLNELHKIKAYGRGK